MKNLKQKITALLSLAILMSACSIDDGSEPIEQLMYNPPTAQEFKLMQENAFNNLKQTTTFQAEDGIFFTSERGVDVTIWGNCLFLNGEAVTGEVTLEFVEIFERGNMLTTNATTVGLNDQNEKEQLISGGEFHVKAYQNGEELTTDCGYLISVPVDITGGVQEEMSGFVGEIDEDGNLIWLPQVTEFWVGQNQGSSVAYNAFVENFGWFNCDYFSQFPDPKTEIEISLPAGFNYTNSNMYVSIVGQPNSLASLYGSFPIGFQLHIIFVSAEGNNFRYAIKTITVQDNQQLVFSINETDVASTEDVIDIINDLP